MITDTNKARWLSVGRMGAQAGCGIVFSFPNKRTKPRPSIKQTGSVMISPSQDDITQLLIAWSNGDRNALDRLTPLVYDDLRRIARSKLRQHGSDAILQPTMLAHEAYVKLVDEKRVQWQNREHFYAIAANTMRRIIIGEYRRRVAEKRGGGVTLVSLNEGDAIANTRSADLFALNEALETLKS